MSSFRDLCDQDWEDSPTFEAVPIPHDYRYFSTIYNACGHHKLLSHQNDEDGNNDTLSNDNDHNDTNTTCIDFLTSYSQTLENTYEVFGPLVVKYQTTPIKEPVDGENGDDHIQFTDTPMTFVSELVTASQLFAVEISDKDTYISSRCGNYSENYLLLPDNPSEAFNKYISKPNDVDSNFLDVSKIRTILPVVSMRQKHSDTLDGKVSMLGKLLMYRGPTCGPLLAISSAFQIVCLNLFKEKSFPFLPPYLGGYGSLQPFRSLNFVIRSFLCFKGGTYYPLLCSIVWNLKKFFLNRDKKSTDFLVATRSKSEHWHDWYKTRSCTIPGLSGKLNSELDSKIVGRYGQNEIWDNAARRLLSAHLLVTDDEILIHQTVEEFNLILLSRLNIIKTRFLLDWIRDQLKPASIFNSKLLNSITVEKNYPDFVDAFDIAIYVSISDGRNETLRNILKSNTLYLSDALSELKRKSPLRVDMQVLMNGVSLPTEKTITPILDQDTKDLYEWFLKLHEKASNQPLLLEVEGPRALLSDDSIIIRRIERVIYNDLSHNSKYAAIIVTNDKALCYRINDVLKIPVFRINSGRDEDEWLTIKKELVSSYGTFSFIFEVDLGSVNHAQDNIRNVRGVVKTRIKKILSFVPYWHKNVKRLENLTVREVTAPQADSIYDKYGALSGRDNIRRFPVSRTYANSSFFYSKEQGTDKSNQ